MYKIVLIFMSVLILVQVSQCGMFGRSSGSSSNAGSSSYGTGTGGAARSASYVGRRNSHMLDNAGDASLSQNRPNKISESAENTYNLQNQWKNNGISAWGLILIITAAIILAFALYYGVLCYPFFCHQEKSWNVLDVSVSTTSGTSSRSTDFESHPFRTRSTTPTETHH